MKKIFLLLVATALTTFSASAQSAEITAAYNEAAAAWGAKDYATAATKFDQVVEMGMDEEGAESMVATAKTQLPKCYYQVGGRAMQSKDYTAAVENFSKAAELAELYDDVTTMQRANTWIGKVYQSEGGAAFNEKNYAAAIEPFSKGYAADPRNTDMAQWLAISYCETGDFEQGMAIFNNLVAMGSNSRYAEAAAEATANIELYTNNLIASMQSAGNYDGIIAFAEGLLEKDPANALAAKIRLQAYINKKDYAGVESVAKSTADMQTSEEERSNVYFILGAAYNAREMRDQAIAAFKQVTAGSNKAAAAAALEGLSAN